MVKKGERASSSARTAVSEPPRVATRRPPGGGQGAPTSAAGLPGISVVVPAWNEEGIIGRVVEEVREVLAAMSGCAEWEIIVVSDGSEDATAAQARAAGAKVVELSPNRGYGAALRRGFREARFDAIVMLDGDGTYPPSAIPRLVRRLHEGADQVIAARTTFADPPRGLRRLAKNLLARFASLLVGYRVPDLNSGMRAFRRGALVQIAKLLPSGFSCSTTLTVAGSLGGWQVDWEPIEYRPRFGHSKFRPVHDTVRLALAILRAAVYTHPLKVFLPAAAILGFLGLALGVFDTVVERNLTDKTVLCFLSALQLFALGLMADLVVRRRGGW